MLDFEDLVRVHQNAVCATAYSVLRDRARSEEVAQDAFLIAWRQLPAMSPPPTLPAWICGIARNLARNAARKRKETAMQPGSDIASTETPLDKLLEHEANEIAARALAALGDRDREVIVLYYRGEQSLAEVASALGITETTARQRLHRGRARLKSTAATVQATLRATRPGPAFTIACVAALATGKTTPAAAATTTSAKSAWIALAVGGALVATIGGAVAVRGRESAPPIAIAPRAESPSQRLHDRRSVVERISAATRIAALERIRAARAARTAGTLAAPAPVATDPQQLKVYDFADMVLRDDIPPAEPRDPGVLSKQTLRYGIALIQPLLLECYTGGRPATGRFVLEMRLVGEPDTGTVIESVDLGGDPALVNDPVRIACLRDTLFTIEFPPMTEPGTWDVIFPFAITPD